jgi:putative SOS response-associated peptidase YedK
VGKRWGKAPPCTKEERRGYITPSERLSSLEGKRMPVRAMDKAAAIAKAKGYSWWDRAQNKLEPMYSRGLFVFVLGE